MSRRIRKVGVIGAGVMGATIAAHMANVGVDVILLDIVPPEFTEEDEKKGLTKESKAFRNRFAQNGLDTALKSKPASFYAPGNAALISIGNMEDDLASLSETDWIIEVVVENLDFIREQVRTCRGLIHIQIAQGFDAHFVGDNVIQKQQVCHPHLSGAPDDTVSQFFQNREILVYRVFFLMTNEFYYTVFPPVF